MFVLLWIELVKHIYCIILFFYWEYQYLKQAKLHSLCSSHVQLPPVSHTHDKLYSRNIIAHLVNKSFEILFAYPYYREETMCTLLERGILVSLHCLYKLYSNNSLNYCMLRYVANTIIHSLRECKDFRIPPPPPYQQQSLPVSQFPPSYPGGQVQL